MNFESISKSKLLLLVICFLAPIWVFSVELTTIIYTVYTENSLQGMLGYFIEGNFYSGGVLPFNAYIFGAGDHHYWDVPNINVCERFYISYQIQAIPVNYSIESVELMLYQNYCCGDGGDDVYPLFYGNHLSCMIDHVDYGLTFEYSDFTPTIYSTIGAISSELAYGWKELDITDAYIQAMNLNRPYCQLMGYFPVLSDYDILSDYIDFRSSYFPDSIGTPQIVITYQPTNHSSDDQLVSTPWISLYPNPCDNYVTLSTKDNSSISEIVLYNLKGQRIKSIQADKDNTREISLDLDNDLVPGIYLLKYSTYRAGKTYMGTRKLLINNDRSKK